MWTLTVQSRQAREVIDITDDVGSVLRQGGAGNGACYLFAQHTTAALTLMDLDPGTDLDLLDALKAMVPALQYRHPHNPGHVPAHILSAIIGPSLLVPVWDGELRLGTWQRVVLLEFDGPRRREVSVSVLAAIK